MMNFLSSEAGTFRLKDQRFRYELGRNMYRRGGMSVLLPMSLNYLPKTPEAMEIARCFASWTTGETVPSGDTLRVWNRIVAEAGNIPDYSERRKRQKELEATLCSAGIAGYIMFMFFEEGRKGEISCYGFFIEDESRRKTCFTIPDYLGQKAVLLLHERGLFREPEESELLELAGPEREVGEYTRCAFYLRELKKLCAEDDAAAAEVARCLNEECARRDELVEKAILALSGASADNPAALLEQLAALRNLPGFDAIMEDKDMNATVTACENILGLRKNPVSFSLNDFLMEEDCDLYESPGGIIFRRPLSLSVLLDSKRPEAELIASFVCTKLGISCEPEVALSRLATISAGEDYELIDKIDSLLRERKEFDCSVQICVEEPGILNVFIWFGDDGAPDAAGIRLPDYTAQLACCLTGQTFDGSGEPYEQVALLVDRLEAMMSATLRSDLLEKAEKMFAPGELSVNIQRDLGNWITAVADGDDEKAAELRGRLEEYRDFLAFSRLLQEDNGMSM